MDDVSSRRKYSCRTASETLGWIDAIRDFIKPYRFFLDAHVVNFFKDRLWEAVDNEWMDYLRNEPVENLLQLPCGVVQDHWPDSLKEFVLTLRSLSLPRDQADLQEAFPGLRVASLNSVIAQGMNQKKKHEIEVLAAVISSVAKRTGANTILDVGSGQGYLAQVLSFEHDLPVIAIDASSHHGSITDARAKRIAKYYAAKKREARYEIGFYARNYLIVGLQLLTRTFTFLRFPSESESRGFSVPKTVTCQVLSPAMLKDISSSFLQVGDMEKEEFSRENVERNPSEVIVQSEFPLPRKAINNSSVVLAGLHACGDLSVTMLRTFMECDEVKAVISIGCCYNLLSEKGVKETDSQCGFPCAERWKGLGKAAGLHNFELHAFRAAFQMVLTRYYPDIIMRNPTIGRQGKALRRQHNRRILESNAAWAESFSETNYKSAVPSTKSAESDQNGSTWAGDPLPNKPSSYQTSQNEVSVSVDRYFMFMKFCKSGLGRLGIHESQETEFSGLWKEAEVFYELVGPYWTLRAALGPVLETFLLLDRLLFLQEQGHLVEAVMLPLFDPVLSPRNVALIAEKV